MQKKLLASSFSTPGLSTYYSAAFYQRLPRIEVSKLIAKPKLLRDKENRPEPRDSAASHDAFSEYLPKQQKEQPLKQITHIILSNSSSQLDNSLIAVHAKSVSPGTQPVDKNVANQLQTGTGCAGTNDSPEKLASNNSINNIGSISSSSASRLPVITTPLKQKAKGAISLNATKFSQMNQEHHLIIPPALQQTNYFRLTEKVDADTIYGHGAFLEIYKKATEYYKTYKHQHNLALINAPALPEYSIPPLSSELVYSKSTIGVNPMPRVTVLLDLDETLIHSQANRESPTQLEVTFESNNNPRRVMVINKIFVYLRPYVREFLEGLRECEWIECAVFTASNKVYADAILKEIDPENKYFGFRLYRESCLMLPGEIYTKDLRRIKNRKLDRMLLVDNSPFSFANKPNSVPIVSFYNNKEDSELRHLLDYLRLVTQLPNMLEINEAYFSGLLKK